MEVIASKSLWHLRGVYYLIYELEDAIKYDVKVVYSMESGQTLQINLMWHV